MGFQHSAEYQIFHCSIRPNTNTNSCWTDKENKRKSLTCKTWCKTRNVLCIIHSALVVSSSHTAKYFHSRLRRLCIIHNNYGSIKIRAVTQYYSTWTDWWSRDYSIDQLMVLLPSASCLHGAMQLMLRPAADEAFPDTHLTACDPHCSGATAVWCAMLIMLYGVTGGPTMSRGLEIWCPVSGHVVLLGLTYTLQYCRASTDCGSLTCYVHGGAFDSEFKALWASSFAFMAALTQVLIICIRLIFGSTIRPNTSSAFCPLFGAE